jgi:hypothetical protein
MMLARIVLLKPAIKDMFEFEYRNRESKNKPTILEQYELLESDFQCIIELDEVLAPFKTVQEALEGDKYQTLSLVPLLVHQIRGKLDKLQNSVNRNMQKEFADLLDIMNNDFTMRWVAVTSCSPNVNRGARNRQIGIPKLAFWASILDPRTKNKIKKILSGMEMKLLWDDVTAEILNEIIEITCDDEEQGQEPTRNEQQPLQKKHRIDTLLGSFSSDDDNDSLAESNSQRDDVHLQVEQYKKAKGIKVTNENGEYNFPLLWWRENHNKYPYVWMLAKCVLQIPATLASSERVFSTIGNVIEKKQATLTAENANLLLFRKENYEFVVWDEPNLNPNNKL